MRPTVPSRFGVHHRSASLLLTSLAALLVATGARAQDDRVVPDSLPERPRVPIYDAGQPVLRKVLKNGVRLIVQEQRDAFSVAGVVSARMGTRYETEEMSGLGHALLWTMIEGTSRSSGSEFHVRLRGTNSKFDSGVGPDVGQISIETDSDHAAAAAALLADVILYPSLPDTAFEAARVRASEDASFAAESPLPAAYGEFLKVFYAGTPYQRHLQGLVSSISRARRSDLVELHKKTFVGSNIVVVFVGNMDPKKLMAQLEKVFAAAPAGTPPEPAGPEPRPLAADTVLVLERPWKGIAFVYGYPAPGYSDPDYPAFAIIDSYLRSEDRSQIIYWMQVRDEAVSPGIVFTLFPTRGSIAVFFGATPEKLPVARDTTLSVLKQLREAPLEKGEYLVHTRRVQDGFFAKQYVPIVRARNMSRWAAEGLPDDYPVQFETAVLKLTPEAVRAVAERWFTHSCEVILGPPLPASGDGAR